MVFNEEVLDLHLRISSFVLFLVFEVPSNCTPIQNSDITPWSWQSYVEYFNTLLTYRYCTVVCTVCVYEIRGDPRTKIPCQHPQEFSNGNDSIGWTYSSVRVQCTRHYLVWDDAQRVQAAFTVHFEGYPIRKHKKSIKLVQKRSAVYGATTNAR
jgi:hypothetical protein